MLRLQIDEDRNPIG
jgi:hypothetical protein